MSTRSEQQTCFGNGKLTTRVGLSQSFEALWRYREELTLTPKNSTRGWHPSLSHQLSSTCSSQFDYHISMFQRENAKRVPLRLSLHSPHQSIVSDKSSVTCIWCWRRDQPVCASGTEFMSVERSDAIQRIAVVRNGSDRRKSCLIPVRSSHPFVPSILNPTKRLFNQDTANAHVLASLRRHAGLSPRILLQHGVKTMTIRLANHRTGPESSHTTVIRSMTDRSIAVALSDGK